MSERRSTAEPGAAGFETLPVVEWICLELGRSAGFVAPDAVLVDMPEGMATALVVERFNIRRRPDETRRLALEDFCSVLDAPSAAMSGLAAAGYRAASSLSLPDFARERSDARTAEERVKDIVIERSAPLL